MVIEWQSKKRKQPVVKVFSKAAKTH